MVVLPVLPYCQINKLQKDKQGWGFEKVRLVSAAGGIRIRINTFYGMCGIVDGLFRDRNTTKGFLSFRRTPFFAR
jgi:hypothetical protein